MKTSRLFIAFVAAAFLGGGASAVVIASAFRVAPQFPPVGEDQSGGVADPFGDPILFLGRPRGHALVSLHDEALRPRAMFSLDPGGYPDVSLLDDEGEVRASLGFLHFDEEEAIASLALSVPPTPMQFSVSNHDSSAAFAALATGRGGLVRMGMREEKPILSITGPGKKVSIRADCADDETPFLALTDREGRDRLVLAASTPTRKDRP